jgi:hypothetical protein
VKLRWGGRFWIMGPMFREVRGSRGWMAARWRGENAWVSSCGDHALKWIIWLANVRGLCSITGLTLCLRRRTFCSAFGFCPGLGFRSRRHTGNLEDILLLGLGVVFPCGFGILADDVSRGLVDENVEVLTPLGLFPRPGDRRHVCVVLRV